MSERNYTYLTVSGPNAAAAKQSAIKAMNNLPRFDGGWDEFYGSWIEKDERRGAHYFDHNSGQGGVLTVAKISRTFPGETFELWVDGSYGENQQGPVTITNGLVKDGRNWCVSYGDALEPFCDRCDLKLTLPATGGSVECPKCHAAYHYEYDKDGKLRLFDMIYEIEKDTATREAAIAVIRAFKKLRFALVRLSRRFRWVFRKLRFALVNGRFPRNVREEVLGKPYTQDDLSIDISMEEALGTGHHTF